MENGGATNLRLAEQFRHFRLPWSRAGILGNYFRFHCGHPNPLTAAEKAFQVAGVSFALKWNASHLQGLQR